MDELAERGWAVRHNLESAAPGRAAAVAGAAVKRGVEAAGGYGGDFATVLASLREANRADVVLSTVDTVGIPLMLLARARAVRTPFVYVAIGLPERLARLRSRRVEGVYASALGSRVRGRRLQRARSRVPCDAGCVSAARTCPSSSSRSASTSMRSGRATRQPDLDVVSVGADPHRDFELLLAVARALPDVRFLVVTSAEHARSLGERPPNVSVETDLPFDEMRDRLERARVVALPVRDNSYSGATTVLLQAMALAKPVVVTRTAAIATGYGLVDGENVRLAVPGDADDVRGGGRRDPRRRGARDEARRYTRGGRSRRASPGIATSASSRISSRRPPGAEAPLRLGPAAAPPGASSPPARGRMPQVPGQLVGSARCPGMRLDVDLRDPPPCRGRRPEDRRALLPLDVDLDDRARPGRALGRLREDVRERVDSNVRDAHLVLGPCIRRVHRMPPGGTHHVQAASPGSAPTAALTVRQVRAPRSRAAAASRYDAFVDSGSYETTVRAPWRKAYAP